MLDRDEASGMGLPLPTLDHLHRLTGRHGLFEHASFDEPRLEHGYTTDDNARALVVLASGLGHPDPDLSPYLDFVIAARTSRGWHNRMSAEGHWTDDVGPDDTQGRALWGLGHAMAAPASFERARGTLMSGSDFSSPHPRANAYATLGLIAAVSTSPESADLEDFLRRISSTVPRPLGGSWPWPEARLTYDNARIPEALIGAGSVLGDHTMIGDGLALLDWLVGVERGRDGFSFTPVSGRGPGDHGPAFDQQPIEAWAMADACVSAFLVDRDEIWAERAEAAADWFLGRNDVGVPLFDPVTGAGYDGLEPDGVNQNRGAESTLAALGGLLALHRLAGAT